MKTDFNHCESVYWVFTQLCNDKCDHCYNSSGPQGTRISAQDCLRIVRNLPDSIDRLILSGGEPVADRAKLYLILDAVQEKEIPGPHPGDAANQRRPAHPRNPRFAD